MYDCQQFQFLLHMRSSIHGFIVRQKCYYLFICSFNWTHCIIIQRFYFKVNKCFSNPCQNNGTCVQDMNGNVNCICSPKFTGNSCQFVANPCNNSSCNERGTCTPLLNGTYQCLCKRNWIVNLDEYKMFFK